MTCPEEVKSYLWADISSMAKNPGRFARIPDAGFKRKRKLDLEGLLLF